MDYKRLIFILCVLIFSQNFVRAITAHHRYTEICLRLDRIEHALGIQSQIGE